MAMFGHSSRQHHNFGQADSVGDHTNRVSCGVNSSDAGDSNYGVT